MKKSFLIVAIAVLFALVSCAEPESHECSFSEKWESDDSTHWHECTCGARNEEALHETEWIESSEGQLSNVCRICGKIVDVIENAKGVSTLEELKNALSGSDEVVYLKQDIDLKMSSSSKFGIEINRSLSLYGLGCKLYNDSNDLVEYARLVNICNITDGEVVLCDVAIKSSQYSSFFMGLQIFDNKNTSIVLDGVTVSVPHYYAVSFGTGNDESNVKLINSNIVGWASIYNRSSNMTLSASNCRLISINPERGGQDNSFSSVIVAEYYNFNEDVGESKNNTMSFSDCMFVATKRFESSDVTQGIADVRSPYNNRVYFNDCEFNVDNGTKYLLVCKDSTYNGNSVPETVKGSSRVYVNGTDVTETASYVDFYLDE